MVAKVLLLLCAQAFLIQCVLSQCINRGPGLTYDGLVGSGTAPGLAGLYGCGSSGVASSGGGFQVTSTSPFAPTGLRITSENAIEGSVIVGGVLPFLSAVVLEGTLPTAGTGAISYGCGNGPVGIISEGPIATGIVGPGLAGQAYGSGLAQAYGPGLAGQAHGSGLAGQAYGSGLAYGPGLAPGLGLGLGGVGCGSGL